MDAINAMREAPGTILPVIDRVTDDLRDALDTSKRGAPAAGEAVRDLFSTNEIFRRLMATADDELARSNRMLFLSGLVAGLSIGLTFLGRVTVAGHMPDADPRLAGALLYPLGFVFIVLGRNQLFTENTLTPVTLVLTRLASLPRLFKLWGLVYVANLLGAAVAALLIRQVLDEPSTRVALDVGEHALGLPWSTLVWDGFVAGWIVAGMVWLTHAVRESTARLWIVWVAMMAIPIFGVYHCVSGACEMWFYALAGRTTVLGAIAHFLAPVTLGNILGGVMFVALPNYFQTRRDRIQEVEPLSWREWLLGSRREAGASNEPVLDQ